MKQAVALVKSDIPPEPAKIQAVHDAGRIKLELLESGNLVRLNSPGYLKSGDNLSVVVNPATNGMVA